LTLSPDPEDSFVQRFNTTVLGVYHFCVGSRIKPPTDLENGWYKYNERRVVGVANVIGTLVSSILPVVAVVVLYFVKSLLARLGMVACERGGLFIILPTAVNPKTRTDGDDLADRDRITFSEYERGAQGSK
jgi:hypothetical protein